MLGVRESPTNNDLCIFKLPHLLHNKQKGMFCFQSVYLGTILIVIFALIAF